jgi:hypothetical protein
MLQMAICAGMLLLMGSRMQGAVTVQQMNYYGWEGAYRMTNGTVELVFVPQIGRVMRYGFVGGANLLWENTALWGKTAAPAEVKDWINYGGDKLWPAPQERWGWPPDPYLDGSPHTVTVLPDNRLRVESPFSEKHGIRFVREITLAASGTEVTFLNTMINASDRDQRWSVWQVTQIDDPDVTEMPSHAHGRNPKGYYVFPEAEPEAGMLTQEKGLVRLRRSAVKASKIGGDSPKGWIAARRGTLRLTMSATYEPGQEYPDNGSMLEIYTNPDPLRYIELELLGPIRTLRPGEKTAFTTRWRLQRVSQTETR